MQVIELDIDVYIGSAFNQEVTCYTDTARTVSFDFSDYEGKGTIYDEFGGTTDKTSQCDITVGFNSDPSDGALLLTIAKALTGALTAGNFVFDILLWSDSSAEEEVWFRGVARIHEEGTER